jgi:hypothetical protein
MPWGFPDPVRQPREFLEALIKRVEATDKENYFKVGRRQKSFTKHMRMLLPLVDCPEHKAMSWDGFGSAWTGAWGFQDGLPIQFFPVPLAAVACR